jgi:hypothetical protein
MPGLPRAITVGMFRILLFLVVVVITLPVRALDDAELAVIGRRVWKNECGGTREGLTSWNTGENFASLGIGHFIWYPKGVSGPFEESFPELLRFFTAGGVKLPAWLKPDMDCPWKTRAEFQAAARSPQMSELRDLLASTITQQSRFLARRMEQSLPKMTAAAPAGRREHVRRQFERLAATGKGTFALIDYVNFKGEGTNPKERYKGEGWGLLQVLEGMDADANPPAKAFGDSAARVLARRVKNSPADRGEARWLPGWTSRVKSYAD